MIERRTGRDYGGIVMRCTLWIAFLGIAAWAALVWGSQLHAASPDAGQIRDWLAQLDDEDFARREAATQKLREAGEASIEALANGAVAGSPETAWRAGEALKQIAIDGNERTLDRVAAALERVGVSSRGGMNKVVAEIRGRQRQIRHDRAAAKIRQLGGGLSGGGAYGEEAVWLGGGIMMPVAMPIIVEEEARLVEVEVAGAAAEAGREAAEAAGEAAKVAGEAAAAAIEAAAAATEPAEPPAEIADEVARAEEHLARAKDVLPKPLKEDLDDIVKELFPNKPAEAKPADEVKPADDEPVAEIAVADLDIVPVIGAAIAVDFVGGDMVEAPRVASESLSLDANWRGGDKGLEALRDLPEVVSLSIRDAKMTDAGLAHIAALPRLRSLQIQGTKFSALALRKLHRARPEAYMFCQGEAMMGIHADTTGSCTLTSVYPGSGAAEAGLQAGDKIVAIDGLEVRDFSELTISVYGRGVGEKLKVDFERDGKRHLTQVELRARKVLEP
jgi:hypothetical protein